MSAIEVLNRTRKVLNTNPVIKAHLDSYCFYLENEGRGKTEAREEVFDFVNELESEFDKALLALEQKEEMQMQIKRIEDCINEFETGGYFEENTLEEPSEFFIRDLKKVLNKMKEVLDRVGEQK